MHSQVVLVAAFAAAASAIANPAITAPPVMRRFDIPGLDEVTSIAGQVGTFVSGAAGCATAIAQIADGDGPDASDELEDAINSALLRDEVTDQCIGTLMPASLSAEYSTYESSYVAWYTSHKGDIQSAVDKCGDDTPTSLLKAITPCSTALAQYSVTDTITVGGAQQTSGGNGGNNGGNGGNNNSPGAAPKPTGFVAGAVAVAGVIGAAAVML